jgi:L-asparagine oxygenase
MVPYRIEKCLLFSEDFKEQLMGVPTPTSLEEITDDSEHSLLLKEIDLFFGVNAMRFGSIYGFAQEQNGQVVQNLFPIKRDEGRQISSSSETVLEMHTETAFHPWRPEVVMLLCMRGDVNAGTNLATLPDIVARLDEETIRILHLPEFTTRIDESFQSEEQPDREILTPILFNNATSMTYDRALMKSLTEAGNRALQAFSNAIEEVKKTVFLKTGEILVINNRTTVHGRTPFKARYDGTDRWLKRAMVSTKLPDWDEMEIRDGRWKVVTTRF